MNETAALAKTEPAPSIEQLTVEVKFYLGQTAQNILEVGKRLIQAKEMLPHGEWQNWLKDNFNLSIPTARKFMQIYERFGITRDVARFATSQMVEMLALPAADTETFIETKAAEGNPVADMTIKQLREEIQQWKSRAEVNDNAVKAKERRISQLALDFNNLQNAKKVVQQQLDAARDQLRKQKPIIQAPADYDSTKKELADTKRKNIQLQQQLDARPVQIPDDYHDNKKKLAAANDTIAQLQQQIDVSNAEAQKALDAEDYATAAHKLDVIAQLINDLLASPHIGAVLRDYQSNKHDRYSDIVGALGDFLDLMND